MNKIEERVLKGKNGWVALALVILGVLCGLALIIVGFGLVGGDEAPQHPEFFALAAAGFILFFASIVCSVGLKVLAPNEAMVLTLFGKYYGTLNKDGFYFINPFCTVHNPAASLGKVGK